MLETSLQKKILHYLSTQADTFSIKIVRANACGTPDILVCYKGFFIYIEVKSPARAPRTTPLQRHTMTLLDNAGARGFVTNSYYDFLSQYTSITTTLDNLLKL